MAEETSIFKERETYTATKGVENEGYEFEIAVLAYYGLHLCYHNKISDFKIAIYDDGYHPFDDVVIDIKTDVNEKYEKYTFQLKHVKDKLILNSHHFGKNGKMVLSKYFKFDFTKSHHVILFTNGLVKEELKVGNYTIQPKSCLSSLEATLDSSDDEQFHIYEVSSSECSNKITFYTSQKSRHEIEDVVKQKFKKRFSLSEERVKSVYQNYKHFFQLWKTGIHKICKLDKQDIKMKIAEILLNECMLNYRPIFRELIDEKTKLLQQLLSSFNATIIHEPISEVAMENLSCTDLNKNKLIEYGKEFLVLAKADDSINKKIAIILWRLRKNPLVIKISDEDNQRMVQELMKDLCKENLSLLVIGDISREVFKDMNILENLNDLSHHHYREVTTKFKLSIQGQTPILLEDLIHYNSYFKQVITIRELILMLQNEFILGEEEEVLPEPYIPRRLLSTILQIESIEQIPNDIFIIHGLPDVLKRKLKKIKLLRYSQNIILSHLPPRSVIWCEENPALRFTTFSKHKNNVHLLKIIDNERLQLIESKQESDQLKKFQMIPENKLYETVKSNMNLVCGRPGMGKLTMLKYLKKNCPPGNWTVKVDLQECQSISQNDDDFICNMRKCFEDAKRVIYFYYGIGTLQKDRLHIVVKHIRALADDGFQVWVFSEDHLRETLEKLLNVTSINIEEFNEEERKEYIQSRLGDLPLDQGFEKILVNFKLLKNNNILGTPMHLYMLTEIFINNPKANVEEVFLLTNIYQYFVETKYRHYLKKNNCDHWNQFLEDGMHYRTDQYKLAAASSFFIDLKIQCDSFFLEQIKHKGDVVGIILKINEKGAIFSQQTYSDYFAALWLANNYHTIKQMDKFIFREEHKNILFMFNLELTKNNLAHVAVLYQNYDQLQKYRNKLGELDLVKRSPLHLACSYDTKYPRLHISDQTTKVTGLERIKEDENIKKIIDFLTENVDVDPLKRDELFGWNLFDYAFTMMNLYAVEKILTLHPEIDRNILEKLEDDLYSIAYYSIRFGYKNLFNMISKEKSFNKLLTVQYSNGETLLHVATKSGFLFIVEALLDAGAEINRHTKAFHRRSPLHLAADGKHFRVVELLLNRGATKDSMDRHRSTPLHLAANKNDFSSAQLLIQLGADVNCSDNFGRTPLHRAAASGHRETAKLLLSKGAKVDQQNNLGRTPLDYAIANEQEKVKNLLLKNGASHTFPSLVRRYSEDDFEGYTSFPLHWAAIIGQTEAVDRLLTEGCQINELDNLGRSPLHLAVLRRNCLFVQTLLQRGANVNVADKRKITPVFWAVNNQDIEMLHLLLKNDANVDVRDSFNKSPLHWGVIHGDLDIIKLLMTKNPDLEIVDNFGQKPVDWAAEKGHREVTMLLDKGNTNVIANAETRSAFFLSYQTKTDNINSSIRLSPFLVAVDSGNVALVKKFISLGSNINETDDFGYTALWRAVLKEQVKIVQTLLDGKANIVTVDRNISLLHWAAFCDNPEIAKLLLDYNIDINALDDFGYSSLHIAAMKGHSKTLSFLIKFGANFNNEDKFGNTTLDWACKEGHVEIVELLMKKNAAVKAIQGDLLDMVTVQKEFFNILDANHNKS